jgi:23S rRNA (cytidine1920-2'-O)/16S rRNA (cytidine1409-2'-O)-methyltransferase
VGRELKAKARVDDLLVARGLAATRDEAARIVMAGDVSVRGRRIEKPGEQVPADVELRVRAAAKHVSRGGGKLEAALDGFGIDVVERVCLDAGCSTGGFTDCLLQRGAKQVYAVDVGYGQIAWALRNHPRVVLFERTNIRSLRRTDLVPPPTLVVADLSFVSLCSVLPALVELCARPGELVVLVKPQFELPRASVTGGVVKDPALRARAVEEVAAAARRLGLAVRGPIESPVPGAEGNRELFLALACF